jgi:hypothetical protein
MERFSGDGRLIIPLSVRKGRKSGGNDEKARYVLEEAYCPKGCNIVDPDHEVDGFPGLRIKFRRPGMEGEFILSAVEGSLGRIILSGQLEDGVKDDLYCPHCGVMFEVVVNCTCKPDADVVAVGLTPSLDFNNSVCFCNVTGCGKGTSTRTGDVIRRLGAESE